MACFPAARPKTDTLIIQGAIYEALRTLTRIGLKPDNTMLALAVHSVLANPVDDETVIAELNSLESRGALKKVGGCWCEVAFVTDALLLAD